MEGASGALAGHHDDILPNDVQFILAWNPPRLCTEEESKTIVNLRTRAPPETNLSAFKTTTIGCCRKAAFYNKHLAPHLILKRVVYFDKLVSTMANTVDQAIQDAVAKRPLPKKPGMLRSEEQIKDDVEYLLQPTTYRENGVAQAYAHYATTYYGPIASTLALHPSFSDRWITVLNWTTDGKARRWAIADGVLRISQNVFTTNQLLQNEDDKKKDIIYQLAERSAALAVWELKSLTVGTAQVMQEIVEMGLDHAEFPWKKCTLAVCDHKFVDNMKESSKDYDRGVDPRSPPWTLPSVPSTSSADSPPTPLGESRRSPFAQGGTTARPSRKETSLSTVKDGKRVRKKRSLSGSDALKYERAPKKIKVGLGDESYKPPTSARKDVNAQSFLQQVASSFLVQIPILTALYLRLDVGRGGAQQLHYNDSAFRKSRNNRNSSS
jgi:hypothetical protein